MAKVSTVALLLGGASTAVFAAARGLAPLITTSPGVTTYLSACGFYPPIDPALTVTTTIVGETLSGATVSIGATPFLANDTLAVNPDPRVPCSFDTTLPPAELCGPCPGLTVVGAGTPSLSITGVANATTYEACLRRVVYRPISFGGEEGFVDRIITFTVTSGTAASATKTITVVPATSSDACSALLSSTSVTLSTTLPPDGPTPYPLPYDADCVGTACNALLYLAPAGLTVTTGSSGLVGRADLFFNLFSRGPSPGVFLPAEDRVAILPDPAIPGSTYSNPCPGLGFRVLFGTAPGTPGFGLFAGVEVYGPASGAVYTSCLRRAVYYNIAASPAAATLGLRPTAVRAFSVPLASGESFFGLVLPVTVVAPDGTCSITPCARGPTDAELAGGGGNATVSASFTPVASPGTGPGSSASRSAAPSTPAGASATRSPFNSNLLPPNFRRVTWFSHGDCSTDTSPLSRFGPNAAFSENTGSSNIRHRSVVVVRDGVCNFVPSAPVNTSYLVSCSSNGQATISFCSAGCGFCSHSYTLRGDNSQCWPAAPGFGAAALKIDCGRQSLTDLNPLPGDAYIRWNELAVCSNEISQSSHMLVPQNVCNTVPGATSATNSGYRISCDNSGTGSGSFEVCDNNCGTCRLSTHFSGIAQCNPNPPETGSASVRFHCGATVLSAQREENGVAASGTSATEASLITAAGAILVGAAAAGLGLA